MLQFISISRAKAKNAVQIMMVLFAQYFTIAIDIISLPGAFEDFNQLQN